MGLDYTILYRKGKENVATDALSRRGNSGSEGSCHAITAVAPEWVKELVQSYDQTDWLRDLLPQLVTQPSGNQGYSLSNGLIRFQGRLVVGDDRELKERILQSLHCSPVGGHSRIKATHHKVKQLFFCPKQKKDVIEFVLAC